MNIILFEEGTDFFPGTDERCIHLRKVLHKTAGDTFAAGVVNGPSGTARITEITVQGVRFSFQPEQPFLPPDPVWLLVGFPRPIQLKRLLRAAASLGVSGILLCGTDLGEKSYRQSGVLARGTARAAVLDGAMQSGYTAVPEIAEQETLDAALNAVQTRFPAAAKIVLDVAQDGVRPPELAQVQP
ncbi:MAG: 16S rRNA (uracil(1498)-N(3))-methyltransferase, partial [Spirochaetes bacterium]|nr:16S rRNA (uracil(1498)-N(3))-methyltransferase [Candidatus Avitreponema avistercoris]